LGGDLEHLDRFNGNRLCRFIARRKDGKSIAETIIMTILIYRSSILLLSCGC
jgi:hypothetical protein